MLFAEAQGLKTGGSPLSGEFDRVLNGILERLNMRLKGMNLSHFMCTLLFVGGPKWGEFPFLGAPAGTSDKFIQRGERLQSQREMFDYIFEGEEDSPVCPVSRIPSTAICVWFLAPHEKVPCPRRYHCVHAPIQAQYCHHTAPPHAILWRSVQQFCADAE